MTLAQAQVRGDGRSAAGICCLRFEGTPAPSGESSSKEQQKTRHHAQSVVFVGRGAASVMLRQSTSFSLAHPQDDAAWNHVRTPIHRIPDCDPDHLDALAAVWTREAGL